MERKPFAGIKRNLPWRFALKQFLYFLSRYIALKIGNIKAVLIIKRQRIIREILVEVTFLFFGFRVVFRKLLFKITRYAIMRDWFW